MKKVLFFTYDFPYPTTSGGKNRAYHMLKYGGQNVELHLFSFIRSDFKKEYVDEIKKIGISNITLFERKSADKKNLIKILIESPFQSIFKSLYYSKEVEKQLHAYLLENKISIFHAESFYTSFYISNTIKQMGIKQIYGSENVEHILYKEYVKNSSPFYLKSGYRYQVKKIEHEERLVSNISDTTIAVSEEDKSVFETITQAPVEIVDNGIDTKNIQVVKRLGKRSLLFVGNFSYFPNIEAVENFYKNTFVYLNDAKLIVVGKKAREKLSFVKNKNIEVYNFVPDLVDVYRKADIFVFPIQFGGGTNFKLLEAMAYGLPVVGFDDKIKNVRGLKAGDYVAVRTYVQMKEAIEELFTNRAHQDSLAKRARSVVESNYSWEKIGKNLSNIWQNL